MWKYVTRRFRDTFERSANHFDKRPTTNIVNTPNVNEEKQTCPRGDVPCIIQSWFRQRNCIKKTRQTRNTNDNRWNFEHLNRSWIGAITWSSALALGWCTSQLIHSKIRQSLRNEHQCVNVNNLITSLKPYASFVNNRAILNKSAAKHEKILENFTPKVHLVSNDHSGEQESTSTGVFNTPDSSKSDLGEVLNSIENKLGLAAVESGQHQVGLNLLRSAANRHHAPAMFNLGLCYEMGLIY